MLNLSGQFQGGRGVVESVWEIKFTLSVSFEVLESGENINHCFTTVRNVEVEKFDRTDC